MTGLGQSIADYTQLRTIFDDIETRETALQIALFSNSPSAAQRADNYWNYLSRHRAGEAH
jgi:hypothetical protein